MLTTLTLPALGLLMALSGIPGLKALPGFKGLSRHKPVPTAADSLPPAWRPASRLAIDRLIVRPGLPLFGHLPGQLTLNPMFDPRKVRIMVDPDSGLYTSAVEVGDLRLGAAYRTPLTTYGSQSMMQLFQDRWMERSRRDVNSLGTNTASTVHTGLSLPIPVQLPKIATSILGPGGPALNVSGSESIRLSGTSNWSNQTTGILGQRKSLFPSLDMQQDLDIRLEGQLSDRVKVNLLQNSASQVPLANRIAINYRGEEDDLIQALDLGNTSLSLPGTQYVSYSGKNEGLFGVKLASRIGPLDFTALASKQEGRSERASYSGGAARNTQILGDVDYVKGQYFLLFDPGSESAPRVYDIDDASITLYKDDGNYGNDNNVIKGNAMIDPDHALSMPLSTLQDTSAFRGSFDILKLGADQDFEIISNYYAFHASGFNFAYKIIRLHQAIPPGSPQCLAVSYTAKPTNLAGASNGPPITVGGRVLGASAGADSGRTLLKMLRAPRQLLLAADPSNPNNSSFDTTSAFNPVRELEMKNFYQLSGFGIDPTSFKLTIQHGRADPPITSVQPPGALKSIPYIEVLGLDNLDESTGQPIRGNDGKVDGAAPNSGARLFVDYQNGVVWFPDPRPFAPRIVKNGGQRPFLDAFMSDAVLNRRAALDSTGDLAPNTHIYDKYNVEPSNDAAYYISAEYAASRGGGEITLGRGSIIDGSDVVTVNGERWKRDTDYTIDYDLGRISLKRQLGPADQLNIDYSYAPLFQQAGRTLIGSAFRLEGRDKSLGGAFLYESRGAQDLRPRLGEEPSRTLITDINSEWRFRPSFLTRFANALPGVRTTTPSEFNVQAEAGASFPNPNTSNVVFIDDMEGVRDAVSLSLTPERWRWSSVPRRADILQEGRATVTTSFLSLAGQHNAEIHWYSPPNVVLEKDLKPTLTEAQGGKNPRQVLAISIPHRPLSANLADTLWSGLTYPLDQVGLDLSRSQFIELWVNDFHDEHRGPGIVEPRVRGDHVKLHIDLGVVSEDQMRAPNRPPNGILDSEDQPTPVRDHQLTVVDGGKNEDTGYDGLLDADEQDRLAKGTLTLADLTTAGPDDPEGDDYRSTNGSFKDIDPRKYRFSNGTEGSKGIYPYPDTEDLNLDDQLNTQEDYFEYTVDLSEGGSPQYLVTDVQKEFAGVASDNGWRRYRIPISDSLRVQFGVPDLTIARHVRLWLEGMQRGDSTDAAERKPMVMLGGFDIVGSRWLATDLTKTQKDSLATTVTLNSVNSLDNADIYVPPFDPGQTRNTNQAYTRREQSISMEFTELGATDTLESYRTFSLEEDYSRYGALNWYAAGFEIPGYDVSRDSLFYFVRLSTDEQGQNYYEIKRRVPSNSAPLDIHWEQVRAGIAELSNFKLAPDFPKTDPILFRAAYGGDGDSVIIKGRPSFTRLRRISFGLINAHAVLADSSQSRRFAKGQLWFDELRATEVAKDVGYANRVLVNGRVANLLNYNVAWNSRDADFLSVGESRGSGSRQTGLALTSQFDAHRFFEGTGIQLPVSVVYNVQSSKPRFTAGDDVVRTGAQQAASETRNESKTVSTSYSRVWNDRSNPFLRYTVGGITGNISRAQSDASSPTTIQHQTSVTAGVNYQVAPRSLLAIGLPFGKAKFFPLPERVYWNYQVNESKSSTFTRSLDGTGLPIPSSILDGRSANIDFGADTRPVDLISHHIEGRRALSLDNTRLDKIGFINFGRLVSWRQSFSSRYALQRGPWLRPSMSWNSSYSQNNDVQSQDLAIRAIGNGQNIQFNWDLPFDQINRKGGATVNGVTQFAAVDSTGKQPKAPHVRHTWRDIVARLGQVSADGTLNRSSAYSRLSGTPNLLYLAGLGDNPGFGPGNGVHVEDGSVSNTGLEWRGNARTRIPVVYGSFLSTKASYGDRNGNANGVITRSRDWRFPDVEVDYGQIADALRLTRFLQTPQLRTAWTHSESRDYQGSATGLIGTSSSDDFHPLLSVRGNFKNGTTADLSMNKRSTTRESFQIGHSTATDQNTDLNLTLSRSYSQGQKVKFLGKTSTVRSNINLQLATVYSRHQGGTILEGGGNQVLNPIDETRLSMNGTGSYGFSSNVTGSAVLGFSTNRDRYIVRRSVRVEMRAQFTF